MSKEAAILQSWRANADNWIATIDNNEIESRVMVTNKAIVDAVVAIKPDSVLDIGCGEGWLTRELISHQIKCIGIDAIPALIDNAMEKNGNNFLVCSYETLLNSDGDLLKDKDVVVFNFSLLDEVLTERLIHFLSHHLPSGATIFIQTLHPLAVAAIGNYSTGWKDGSWDGLTRQFLLPYQWFFRTLKDWIKLFTKAGLNLIAVEEPLHPLKLQPASVIFILQCNGS